jgi:hypothetical protein
VTTITVSILLIDGGKGHVVTVDMRNCASRHFLPEVTKELPARLALTYWHIREQPAGASILTYPASNTTGYAK